MSSVLGRYFPRVLYPGAPGRGISIRTGARRQCGVGSGPSRKVFGGFRLSDLGCVVPVRVGGYVPRRRNLGLYRRWRPRRRQRCPAGRRRGRRGEARVGTLSPDVCFHEGRPPQVLVHFRVVRAISRGTRLDRLRIEGGRASLTRSGSGRAVPRARDLCDRYRTGLYERPPVAGAVFAAAVVLATWRVFRTGSRRQHNG